MSYTQARDYSANAGHWMLLTAGGWPVSQDTYYPFGAEPYPAADQNHYKFSGKERDAESGNDNFGARYYSSAMGRFLTPDFSDAPEAMPYADLGNPQSFNRYVYANNNPLGGIDTDGHSSNGQSCGFYGTFLNTNTGMASAAQVPCSSPPAAGDPTETIAQQQTKPPKRKQQTIGRLASAAGIAFARFGRLGGPAHRAAVSRISKLLKDDGYTVTPEKYIPTPSGTKPYRFADVYGKNETTGEIRMFQVGRSNANGSPVAREVRALDDIQGSTGIRPQFVDYNSPLVTGEFVPVSPMSDMPEAVPEEIPTDIP